MEFELTRDPHMKACAGLPFTVSAMFKETSEAVYKEAWRILAEACKGRELMPEWVAQEHELARNRYSGDSARLCQQPDTEDQA